jgi:hypothetical protein
MNVLNLRYIERAMLSFIWGEVTYFYKSRLVEDYSWELLNWLSFLEESAKNFLGV